MTQLEELALVLDITDYRETSSLVRVFTQEEGRISLVARGLRTSKDTRAAAALQPFNLVRLRFSLKGHATIGNLYHTELEQAAIAPHDSIESYALLSFWFEILKVTTQERISLSDVFSLTQNMMTDQRTRPGLTLEYIRGLTSLAAALGFALAWDKCVVCDRVLPLESNVLPRHFSIARGGIVCQNCARDHSTLSLSTDEAHLVRRLVINSNEPEQKKAGAEFLPLLNLIHRFLVHHIEQPLKTISFVNSSIT